MAVNTTAKEIKRRTMRLLDFAQPPLTDHDVILQDKY